MVRDTRTARASKVLISLALALFWTGVARAAGSMSPPAALGPKTLAGFGGSPGTHEFFLQPGSSWKGDLTGIGAGPTWSLVILGIDATGVTGPADRFIYFNLQGTGSGSLFKNIGINFYLDATGCGGGTCFQAYQQFTSEGMSSHGLNPGVLTTSDFDLRFDFTKAATGDGWTITPYFRLAGGPWTLFFDGSFVATVGGIDFNAAKLVVGFDGGADGSLSFGNYYLAGPPSTTYVDDDWAGLPSGDAVQFPGETEYRTIDVDAFDTIQEGIDAVSGSTVNVAAGTYDGFKVDTKNNVSVVGSGGPVVSGAKVTVPISTGSCPNMQALAAVESSTNVTVEGLVMDAAGYTANCFFGVIYYQSSGTIADNTIQNVAGTGGQARGAIRAQECTSIAVLDNTITEYDKVGILSRNTDSVQIERNSVSTTFDGTAPNGIIVDFYHGTTGTIKDNVISGAHHNQFDPGEYETEWSGAGILVIEAGDSLEISGNDVRNSDVGIDVESDSSTVTCNTVGYNFYGYVLWNANPVINSNAIWGSASYGLYRTPSGDLSGTVNAESNWWGCVSGPPDPACDAVSGNVDFTPAATSVPACVSCSEDADCDDGLACNGTEICNPGTAKCQAGTPVDCSGVCETGVCEEPSGTCVVKGAGTPCRPAAGVCDVPESCDGVSGDCPADAFVPDGTACDDGDACTTGEECTAGVCGGGTATTCAPCETCEPPGGCVVTPKDTCREPVEALKASLLLRNKDEDDRDRLVWKWIKGEKTDAIDFGDPVTTDDYALCIYEGNGPSLLLRATAPFGGTCPGGASGRPCWKGLGRPPGSKGYTYKDRDGSPDGLDQIRLKPGDGGKAKVIVKGRGANLGLPSPLDVELPVTVQLQAANGECWEATYYSVGVKKNQADQFKAKAGSPSGAFLDVASRLVE